MKILLVGARGTLGMAVRKGLGNRHEITAAGRSSGDVRVDLTDEESIKAMFDKGPSSAASSPPRRSVWAWLTAAASRARVPDRC